MQYDAETNILCWELGQGDISHVREFGNFIVHLTKSNRPILVEILDASKFVGQLDKLKKSKEFKQAIAVN